MPEQDRHNSPNPPGRPKRYDKRTATALRFDPDLHRRMAEYADMVGVSMNWLVGKLCEEGMKRVRPAEEISLFRDDDD